MKELVEAVRTYGKGIGTDIVKVDMFLNHRLDTNLLVKMGQAFADVFACEKPDLVLTIEASGIAAALTTAMACGNIPVVFAKKSSTRNVTGDVYESTVFSFTHGVENHVRVAKEYLPAGARVLIIDDFLANGEAAEGLCDLCRQAGATVVGIGICVEKAFQPGHQKLEKDGYKVHALAKVLGIEDGKLLPPFVAISGLGESAAWDLMEGRKGKTFLSIEEVAAACPKVSKTHIQMLKDAGAFGSLPDTSQVSLF